MLRPALRNILIFFFVKYFLFYVFLMFKNKDYTFIEINSLRNFEDLFYYLWVFLFLPVVCCLIFSAPIYFAFKIKNEIYFGLLMGAIFIGEYFLYTYYASQSDLTNGVYNGIISVLLFALLFYKKIKLLFSKHRG